MCNIVLLLIPAPSMASLLSVFLNQVLIDSYRAILRRQETEQTVNRDRPDRVILEIDHLGDARGKAKSHQLGGTLEVAKSIHASPAMAWGVHCKIP
jgi:hypothetical protein